MQGAQEAMAVQGAQEAMAVQGAQEAMAGGTRFPQPGPYGRNPFTPQKNFPGEVRGYKEPSGGKQTGTGQLTGTGSPPGLAWKLRLPLGMTRSQGPSQGPSATASTSATGGQAARMASMATTRGAACPRRVSVDMTR